MKRLTITFTLILLLPMFAIAEETVSGAVPKTSVDKWTCEEFIAIDEQFKPKAVYWASAHRKKDKKHHSNVLNIEGTEQVVPIVIDECTKEPKASFWQKLKASWDKAENTAKNDLKEIKSDLSDIKTNMLNKTTK